MVVYEREGIEEDDEDDEEDADTSKKEKQNSRSCSMRSKPGQVQSCHTGTLSSIPQGSSLEFKSAADQLFHVRGPLES